MDKCKKQFLHLERFKKNVSTRITINDSVMASRMQKIAKRKNKRYISFWFLAIQRLNCCFFGFYAIKLVFLFQRINRCLICEKPKCFFVYTLSYYTTNCLKLFNLPLCKQLTHFYTCKRQISY